jgi:hypothetical protein
MDNSAQYVRIAIPGNRLKQEMQEETKQEAKQEAKQENLYCRRPFLRE